MKTQTLFWLRTLAVGALAIWLALGSGGIALAAETRENGIPSPVPTDPLELEAFLDSVLESQLEADRVAGAVVVVVKDGQVFFSKGYGYADVERGLPVNPQTTLFRIASQSKAITSANTNCTGMMMRMSRRVVRNAGAKATSFTIV